VNVMTSAAAGVAYEGERRTLWAVAYRLTGCAADADDIVQETFARAMRRGRAGSLERSWLVRVATNLALDALRRRRRSGYPGPWLPSPLETPDDDPQTASASARYDLRESATAAFLLALEALTPRQRAVVVLRDVFEHDAAETGRALGMTQGAVRVAHLRARRALEGYDRRRSASRSGAGRSRAALEAFLTALAAGDADRVASLLAKGVAAVTDGGGEFAAARAPVAGREHVAALYLGLARKLAATTGHVEFRALSGEPAAILRFDSPPPGWAPHSVLQVDLDEDGWIRRIRAVLATRKLSAVQMV
jgi:RNA polymerase sigma-70 factor, ECF subfamily